ncbi:MAG TPA: hypothetical protein VNN09_12990 [Candidatus Competibacteraceae bacterium]|nr:hypothetical protein [Candidatus Competibacteraceae bacterium]
MQTLFGWSEQTWLYLDHSGILLGNLLGFSTLGLAIFGFLKRDNLRRWLSRNRFPEVGGVDVADPCWQGMVFTVSHADTPRWVMERCQPQQVGLIASAQSRSVADELAAHARSLGIQVLGPLEVADADDPAATRWAATELLRQMVKSGADLLAVDLTGGKTPMSLGAFMAAEEQGVDSLYVTTAYDYALRKPDMRSARLIRISHPR